MFLFNVIVVSVSVKSKTFVSPDRHRPTPYGLKCHTSEVNRDLIDNCVIGLVSKIVFDESRIKGLVETYKEYYNSQDDEYTAEINRLSKALASVNNKISNTVNAISAIGFSQALADSLKNFEEEKGIIENQLNEVEAKVENNTLTETSVIEAFNKVKTEFNNGTLKGMREIISLFVDKVIVFFRQSGSCFAIRK